MKALKLTLLSVVILISAAFPQQSVNKFNFEFNTGTSFGVNKLDGAELNPGFGFEGSFSYRFMPHLSAYAGWGWNKLSADNSFAGPDVCFEETGYLFGLEFKHPLLNSDISYFVRAAGLFNHIEIENANGNIIEDSGHGLGWQIAAGVDIPLGAGLSLTPGLKFNSLSRNIGLGGVERTLNYNYVSVKVGINKAL